MSQGETPSSSSDSNRQSTIIAREQQAVDRAYHCFAAAEQDARELARKYAMAGANTKANVALSRMAPSVDDFDLEGQPLVMMRVDVPHGERRQTHYIGRRTVKGADGRPVVLEWQSEPGYKLYRANAFVRNGASFKRTLTCKGQVVKGYIDVFGREGARAPASAEPESATSDWVDPLLAELARSRDGSMRDIVETIQSEQLELVDASAEDVLVIQGGPGTGKTAVGIQRVARLIGKADGRLSTERILVVGPNQDFLAYIASSFRSLGIADVPRIDLPGLWNARDARSDGGLVAKVKAGPRMAGILQRSIAHYENGAARRASKICKRPGVFTVLPMGAVVSVPVAELIEVAASAMSSDRPYRERKAACESAVARHLTTRFHQEHPRVREDYFHDITRQCMEAGLFDALAPDLSPARVLRELLSSKRRIRQICDGLASPEEISQLCIAAPEYQRPQWSYEDRVCLDELDHLIGRPRDADVLETYDHIVIDEGQNVTPMEARAIARRCPTGSMTVMGDLAQRIAPYPYLGWEELGRLLAGGESVRVVQLRKGFRTPRAVLELVAPLARRLAPNMDMPDSVAPPNDEAVTIRQVDDPVQASAERALRMITAAADNGSVAILVPHTVDGEGRQWKDEVRKALGHSVDKDGVVRTESLAVLTAIEARGLEFDHVVVVEPRAIRAVQPSGDQQLYIALTRATRSLTLLHRDDLPRVLRSRQPHTDADRLEEARVAGRCTRFESDGIKCDNSSRHPDGWCRESECSGYLSSTPMPVSKIQYRPLDREGVFARFEPAERFPVSTQVLVSGGACEQFVKRHGGLVTTAASELQELVPVFLEAGTMHHLPGRHCVVEHEGYRFVLHTASWMVIGYDTRRRDRTFTQFKAGVSARVSRPPAVTDFASPSAPTEESEPMRPDGTGIEWWTMTADEFEAMRITDRIQSEREDPDHEILRLQLRADLQRRRKAEGGITGESDGVDAWYERDGMTTIYEVLELGGFDYHHFRQGALNLMEVAYMHSQGDKAVKVLVAQQGPEEVWVTKALINIFDILVAWPEDGEWSGPGATHIQPVEAAAD